MTPLDTRPGGICGWTPPDDNCDAFYTIIPSPAPDASSNYGLDAPSPSPSSPPPSITPASRSVSPDAGATDPEGDELPQTISPYYNATSLRRYKAKLKLDPKWAPRPPNAFILFRRDYAERHKGEEVQSPEKMTLSKRAGKAWHSLCAEEQKIWYDAAKERAEDHQRLNPGYIFKPNKRTRSDHRKHPALRSRREQVEDFVRKSTNRRRNPAKRGRAPTPASVASSASPEPPDTPATSRSRSCSNPPQVACPVPIAPGGNNVLLSGDSFGSLLERPVCPSKELAYPDSSSPYFLFDDSYTESSDDLSELWFDSFAPSPAPYFGDGTPDHMPSPMSAPVQMPKPQFAPSFELTPPSGTSQGASYIPSSSAPLITRRRRSATTSMLPSSTPHTVVTSSLYGWARDDMVTARMAPANNVGAARPSISSEANRQLKAVQAPESTFLPMNATDDAWAPPRLHPGAGPAYKFHDDMLTVLVMDPDRTPRGSICTSHDAPPPAPHSFADYSLGMPMHSQDMYSSAAFDPFDTAGDLESYGVGHYGIRETHEAYGAPRIVDPYALYLAQSGQQD